jgi:predicted PurR-regulated permease PerM
MSVYTINQSRIISIVLILLMGLFIVYALSNLVAAILGAVVLYVLFRPFFIWLTTEKKINRPLSVTFIILISFTIIIIPFLALSILLVNKILYYMENPEIITQIISKIETFVGQNLKQKGMVENYVERAGEYVVSMFPIVMDTALAILLTIAMMYLFLYFMYTKYEAFEGTLIKYLPFREKNSRHFALELKNVTYANIVGQGMIAFVQGLLLAIGFIIFSIPDPLFWGLVTFFLSFLPVIGSPLVFVPAGIIEIASGNTFGGVGILVYGVVLITNIDNLMRLWINKKMGNIHPVITITGVVIGIPLFGILGIVYGPLLLSIFILLIKLYEAAYAANSRPEKERVVSPDKLSH